MALAQRSGGRMRGVPLPAQPLPWPPPLHCRCAAAARQPRLAAARAQPTVHGRWSSRGTRTVAGASSGAADGSTQSAPAGSSASNPAAAADADALPPEFWDERRLLYNRMRHERDRQNKKRRMAAMRAEEEARLAALTPQQRAAYESEMARLRIEAGLAQKAAVTRALAGHGTRIVIDCSYVTEVEERHAPRYGDRAASVAAPGSVRSLAKQIEISMALNRRFEAPAALTVTSFKGPLAAFCARLGAASWPLERHEGHLLEVYGQAKGQIVMLTPDAPQPLEGPLDPGAVYVIGGIVDRSVVKGLSLGWAQEAGVRTARLPVREHAAALEMDFDGAKKTPVLSISDVVVALLEAGRSGGDWAGALGEALPQRVKRGAGAAKAAKAAAAAARVVGGSSHSAETSAGR